MTVNDGQERQKTPSKVGGDVVRTFRPTEDFFKIKKIKNAMPMRKCVCEFIYLRKIIIGEINIYIQEWCNQNNPQKKMY